MWTPAGRRWVRLEEEEELRPFHSLDNTNGPPDCTLQMTRCRGRPGEQNTPGLCPHVKLHLSVGRGRSLSTLLFNL